MDLINRMLYDLMVALVKHFPGHDFPDEYDVCAACVRSREGNGGVKRGMDHCRLRCAFAQIKTSFVCVSNTDSGASYIHDFTIVPSMKAVRVTSRVLSPTPGLAV